MSAIGSEEIIGLFDKEQIEKIQEKSIELKEMKFTEFIKIVRAFFGAAEIIAFANDVADAMGVSVDQEQTAAEIPTV